MKKKIKYNFGETGVIAGAKMYL